MRKFVILILVIGSLWAQWDVVDSVSFTVRIPAEENCYIYCDYSAESLCVVMPSNGVIQTAQNAIDCTPDWLKIELENNFSRLDSVHQDLYANMILNTQTPYIDEVAFCVAHIAPQILSHNYFAPDIIPFNAELIYAYDDSLDYVSIIDYPGSSFYSTTKYFVAESTGSVVDTFEVELPKEIYYWFIVNPKLHKEFPGYIDPNTGNPSPTGYFWRDYLFNHADPEYPLLSDSLKGVETLWNNKQNSLENGALGRATAWIKAVMEFMSYPHHDQPVRIYHLHKGSCSVHSYLSAATARTLLIPTSVTVAFRYDHKWNEFWDRRWIQWEPTNTWMDYYPYDHWGSGDNIPGCFDWRGDGYIWTVTERYTKVCTLKVHISDVLGNPVDGASVTIDSPGGPGPWVTIGWTSSSGDCQFLLGDSVSYFTGMVQSVVGSISPTTIINNSQPDATYYWNPSLSGTIPQLKARPDTLPSNPLDDYKFEYAIEVPHEIVYGLNPRDGSVFSDFISPGNVDFFICDLTDFTAYATGDSFYAFEINEDASNLDSSFILPEAKNWYLVLSNGNQVVDKAVANITLKLLKNPAGVAEGFVESQFQGLQISPNPFSEKTDIRYQITARPASQSEARDNSKAYLKIYDVTGRLVRQWDYETIRLSDHVVWDGRDTSGRKLPAGVYFVQYVVNPIGDHGDFKQIKKMILLR